MVAVAAKKKIIFLKLIDFCQLTSLYLLTTLRMPYNTQWALEILRFSNVEQLFHHMYPPFAKNYTLPGLNNVGYSPKLVVNQQYP